MRGHAITDNERRQFLERGFINLEGALPGDLLSRWRDLAATLETEAVEAHCSGSPLPGACVIDDPAGPRLMRYDDAFRVDPGACQQLLACPAMIAIARDLCGHGAVPLQLDILYKQRHPHPVIRWHQGAPHSRRFPYLNIGVYLDDAPAGDGCLRYVPGTQHSLQDIDGLAKQYGWDITGWVEQPAKAGDILVQDMMILHGSQPKRSPGVRRTIYIEIRPIQGIRDSARQSETWAQLRGEWMRCVVNRARPGDWPALWLGEYPSPTGSEEDVFKALLERREPPIPAVWEISPAELDDYPVPADLRD